MAKTEGITLYTCDRCGKQAYLTADNNARNEWYEVKRITKDGATAARWLCRECNAEYGKLASAADADFNDFMKSAEKEEQ